MKNTIYFFLLITTTLTQELHAQGVQVDDISWTIAGKIPSAYQQSKPLGLAGAAVGNLANKVIIVGGTNFPDKMPWYGGKKNYYSDVFIYTKTTQELILNSCKEALKLSFNLAYGAVCSTAKGMVIAGGENENGLSSKVLMLNWKRGKLVVDYLPELPKALTNASLTVIGDRLYLAGGEFEIGATNQFLTLDLNETQTGWQVLPKLPNEASHSILLNANKEIYLIAGRKRNSGDTSTLYGTMHVYNVKDQRWYPKSELPFAVSAATGVIKGRNLLVFSGDKGETFHQVESLIAAIDREKDPAKREVLNRQKITLQANHPGFSKTVLKYDLITGMWSELKTLMPYGTVTTNAVVIKNEVIIAGGEIKAGVRTPDILIGKFKTLK